MRPVHITGLVLVLATIGVGLWHYTPQISAERIADDVAANSDQLASSSDHLCQLSDEAKSLVSLASVGQVAAFTPMDEPYSISQFGFRDEQGQALTIADLRGKYLLVNLWATWCAPCRAEMPSLDALQREKGSNAFEVIPISVDKSAAEKPKAFFEEISINAMNFYHDKTAEVLDQLKQDGLALGLPVTMLVDRNGCLIGRMNGPAEWNSPDAHNLIQTAINAVNPESN